MVQTRCPGYLLAFEWVMGTLCSGWDVGWDGSQEPVVGWRVDQEGYETEHGTDKGCWHDGPGSRVGHGLAGME